MSRSPVVTLEELRFEEWSCVSRWFGPHMRVLEIGGGSGFQAHLISEHGCNVVSVDVDVSPGSASAYFPVQRYDGRHLPFRSEEFDLVFSSNVLEHVRNLRELLSETARVIKPGGIIIHVLPTPAWRFWTSVAHYPYLLLRLTRKKSIHGGPEHGIRSVAARRGWWSTFLRIIASPPHGEYRNALVELWYFSRIRWLRVFCESGFDVIEDYPNRLFYTGYTLFPSLPMRARRLLSRVLGSSCRIFVMRKAASARTD